MPTNPLFRTRSIIVAVMAALAFGWTASASAHCDTLDGPVVEAARKALDTGNVNLVLLWVQKKDEAEIRKHFQKTVAVRKVNAETKELADMYFFETLVRIHRAGEGAGYTGMKKGVEPPIAAADKALETGKLEGVATLISGRMEQGLHRTFEDVMKKKKYNPNDVAAGRAYASAYVEYTHYVERLFNAAETLAPGRVQKEAPALSHSVEHQELHDTLVRATREPGATGEAAGKVARLLHPHFVKEEEYALPPLGLLEKLARGGASDGDLEEVLPMTRKLKEEFSTMLAEHRQIVGALEKLRAAARQGGQTEYERFADALTLHAQNEEQVLYPAALLVGEFAALKLDRNRG
jgi:hypothetical protein